jgi:hypothetical protein
LFIARKYICDASVRQQPLVAVFPGADARLPSEPEVLEHNDLFITSRIPHVPVHAIDSTQVKAFGRAAQATWYLDRIIKTFEVPNLETRLYQLKSVDIAMQEFLGTLMLQCHIETQISCEALTIAIR